MVSPPDDGVKPPVARAPRQGKRPVLRPAVIWPAAGVVAAVCAVSALALPDGRATRSLAAAGVAAAVLLLAPLVLLARTLKAERAQRARVTALASARDAEVAHLARVRVPAIAELLRTGARVDGAPGPLRAPHETGEEFARALDSVAHVLGSDAAVHRERALRDSVMAAFESVARTMHVMATVQQQVLDQVERSLDDPRLMAEVMKADHAASQMTRKAQTLLVMCGIWPARRETRPVSLYDCVRGAQSRIVEFGRIEVHGGQTLYAAPPAAEGLMHAIAELLENATVFSPSRSQVVVSVREVGAGAVVEIDDAGLGMPPDVLQQARDQLHDDLDLTRLGAVPRLGLACVGRWSRELGFNVELSGTSAYGGTRAVMFVPFRLLTEPVVKASAHRRAESWPDGSTEGRGRDGGAAEHARPDERDGIRYGDPDGERDGGPAPAPGTVPQTADLPRRRSRRGPVRSPQAPDAAAPTARHAAPQVRPEADAAPPWTPEAARASISSVVSGTLRGRAALGAAGTGPAPASDRPAAAAAADEPPLPHSPHQHHGGRS
ncbi:ATP-binding protein [Streptomyces sp. AM 2-1-1]|uniref:ATP-binding protein n=1 Tax=Streptomyces sp. AM 2-1-1 TaxID=3028709 RepID=UPI0023BA3719|nr:ATP-binding protein [Streptomyces sp. AM 2-1-1]WEH39137.1 ATP-binding protein [Streptomyces sp. AM 2-1-1]